MIGLQEEGFVCTTTIFNSSRREEGPPPSILDILSWRHHGNLDRDRRTPCVWLLGATRSGSFSPARGTSALNGGHQYPRSIPYMPKSGPWSRPKVPNMADTLRYTEH